MIVPKFKSSHVLPPDNPEVNGIGGCFYNGGQNCTGCGCACNVPYEQSSVEQTNSRPSNSSTSQICHESLGGLAFFGFGVVKKSIV